MHPFYNQIKLYEDLTLNEPVGKFTLYYYPIFARGEPIRVALAMTGADWEN